MKTKYDAYNSWVSFFIVTCETLITGGLFYLLFLTTEDTPWHKILQAPHLQIILTVMLCYFVSAMQAGVVLYRRKVYAYQILGKVLKSTICFGVLSGVVLELGRFMDAWSYFYLTFLGLLFISLSVFRILMRWGLKRWGILHLHGDVMLNFTNLFCGYREDRLYNAIPYVSIGYLRGIDNNENELSGGIGFINRFRLNKAWDLNLELKGNINNDVMDGIRGGKNMEGSAAIMVGATYRFNRRDWTKGTGISAAEMQAVQNQLKSMNEENASLRNRVNALEEEKRNQPVVTETKASNKLPDATEYVAFFDINKAYLSEKEAVNLEAYANLIKKYPENKFIITGYADKQTGSAEFNERLSKLRAEAVYNTLVDKYGVNKDQLTMEYKGGVDTMFRENPRLSRAAIIRMAK